MKKRFGYYYVTFSIVFPSGTLSPSTLLRAFALNPGGVGYEGLALAPAGAEAGLADGADCSLDAESAGFSSLLAL